LHGDNSLSVGRTPNIPRAHVNFVGARLDLGCKYITLPYINIMGKAKFKDVVKNASCSSKHLMVHEPSTISISLMKNVVSLEALYRKIELVCQFNGPS